MPQRVSIPVGIGRVGGPSADILRKWRPVHRDFAPYLVIFIEYKHLARHQSERYPSDLVEHVAREAQGITRFQGIIGFRDVNLLYALMGTELLLSPRRHERHLVNCGVERPCPEPSEIPAGSWSPRTLIA